MGKLDRMVMDDDDFPAPPGGRYTRCVCRSQCHEVSVDLARDENVRLLRTKVAGEAKY